MDTRPHYLEVDYQYPFTGWHTQLPEMVIDKSFSPKIHNFDIRNGEIRSSPRFSKVIPHPNDGPCRGFISFIDANNVTHTVMVTSNNLWQLLYRYSDNSWLWNNVGSFNTSGLDSQHSMQIFLNKVYWTTGKPGLWYWDGMSNTVAEATKGAGTTPKYGGFYLGELGFHLILLNTVEDVGGVETTFPQRVRWSQSGVPTQWDAAANPNAGNNDMLDVPDAITGFLTIGKVGFILRVNGISMMSLTGQGQKPFQFDHLWASDRGIGNAYSQACASYGPLGVIVSTEEIYKLTASDFDPIGGGARDKILNDLADATGVPVASVVPGLHRRHIHLQYKLVIPVNNMCVMWSYGFEDKVWVRRVIEKGFSTAKMRWAAVK